MNYISYNYCNLNIFEYSGTDITSISDDDDDDVIYYNTIVLQLPTVFSTVTCCTGL